MQPNKLKINENEQIMHLFSLSVKWSEVQRSSEYIWVLRSLTFNPLRGSHLFLIFVFFSIPFSISSTYNFHYASNFRCFELLSECNVMDGTWLLFTLWSFSASSTTHSHSFKCIPLMLIDWIKASEKQPTDTHTNSHTVSVILDHVHLNINVQCTYVCMTVIHLHFPIKLIHLRERGCVFARASACIWFWMLITMKMNPTI